MKPFIWIRPLFKNYTYTIRRGLAKGLKKKGGLSFIPGSKILSKEDTFLQELDLKGKTIYDIGAFEGTFTLFFSRSTGSQGRVITFEANPLNYQLVLENVNLNQLKQVDVINIALGDEQGQRTLMFRSVEAGSGSLDSEVQQALPQMSSVQEVNISMDTLDHQLEVHHLPLPDFIKIDVEGFEDKVLNGMQQIFTKVRPELFIELHGFLMPDNCQHYWRGIIELLISLGYTIKHIETNKLIELDMPDAPLNGHLYGWVD